MRVTNLKKSYGKKSVLTIKDIDFNVKGIIGVLGINGAGKTTFFKVMSDLVLANQKSSYKNDISYFPDSRKFYRMKVGMFSEVLALTYPDFDKHVFLNILSELNIHSNDSITALSKGQKNVLNIAMTIARDTKYYFIDELFSNLDFEVRETITKILIKHTNVEDKLIFISSHEIQDIERLLDYSVILNNRDFTKVYSMEEIISEYKSLYNWFEAVIEGGTI